MLPDDARLPTAEYPFKGPVDTARANDPQEKVRKRTLVESSIVDHSLTRSVQSRAGLRPVLQPRPAHTHSRHCYAFLFRRISKLPRPSSTIVAGSGTGTAIMLPLDGSGGVRKGVLGTPRLPKAEAGLPSAFV